MTRHIQSAVNDCGLNVISLYSGRGEREEPRRKAQRGEWQTENRLTVRANEQGKINANQ